MDFIVDIGNSRIKWSFANNGKLEGAPGEGDCSLEGFDVITKKYWEELTPPARVLLSNVGSSELLKQITTWIKSKWNINADILTSPDKGCSVINAYQEPSCLGTDRWASLVAARSSTNGAVCIVDCGTTITIDALASNGDHQGGLIIPGLSMMRQALTEKTAGIVMDGNGIAGGTDSLLASDTMGAVQGGTLYAMIAVIDRVVADVSIELGAKVTRVITGGDALAVLPLLAKEHKHRPTLVLDGLAIIINN